VTRRLSNHCSKVQLIESESQYKRYKSSFHHSCSFTMDRTSFLKAQPYLYPLELQVSWPPPLPAETSERSACRRQTLLLDFSLSIESLPLSSGNGTSLSQQSTIVSTRPAFFARKSDSPSKDESKAKRSSPPEVRKNEFDPAMCPLELIVNSATLTVPPFTTRGEYHPVPSFSNRFTSPTAYQKLLRRNHKPTFPEKQSAPRIQECAIYLKLDGHIYQMDLSQIENLEMHEANGSLPPSLVIQFGMACIFRIFSVQQDNPNAAEALAAVQTLLVRLLTEEDHVPSEFPVRYPNMASPAGSSTTAFSSSSVNEPGQRDFSKQLTPSSHSLVESTTSKSQSCSSDPQHATNSLQSTHSAGTERGQSSSEQTSKRGLPTTAIDNLSLARKRQAALIQSQTDLATLAKLFHVPESGGGPSRLSDVHDHAVQLMNAVPENIAVSYGSQSHLESVIQLQNEQIHEYEVQMNELVLSFWPGTSRNGSIRSIQQPSLDRPPQIDAETCIAKANTILALHKAAIFEKLAMSLLPSRGS
jgi:hypothetical protein